MAIGNNYSKQVSTFPFVQQSLQSKLSWRCYGSVS